MGEENTWKPELFRRERDENRGRGRGRKRRSRNVSDALYSSNPNFVPDLDSPPTTSPPICAASPPSTAVDLVRLQTRFLDLDPVLASPTTSPRICAASPTLEYLAPVRLHLVLRRPDELVPAISFSDSGDNAALDDLVPESHKLARLDG